MATTTISSGHQCSTKSKQIYKENFYNIKMKRLSLDELKLIAKSRGIKGYKNKSKMN